MTTKRNKNSTGPVTRQDGEDEVICFNHKTSHQYWNENMVLVKQTGITYAQV